jgi:SAM-dependent methyltransferase
VSGQVTLQPARADRYHELLQGVERSHWWFVALRELVVGVLAARVEPGVRVLDAGCSTGHLLAAVPPSYERTGVDVNRDALRLARSRPAIDFLEASVEELPFEDGTFDAAIATDVVSAVGVSDERAALRELARVLRPGGVLILQVAAYEWLRSGHDVAVGTRRRYTAPSLRRLLLATGLQPEHVTYRVTALLPIAAAWRLARRRRVEHDLRQVRPGLTRILTALMRVENRVARRWRLPFGLSVFAVATAAGPPAVE